MEPSGSYYVEDRLAWRGERCDFRTYLGDWEEHVTDRMIEGAIRKVTMELALLIDQVYPEDITGWREALVWQQSPAPASG